MYNSFGVLSVSSQNSATIIPQLVNMRALRVLVFWLEDLNFFVPQVCEITVGRCFYYNTIKLIDTDSVSNRLLVNTLNGSNTIEKNRNMINYSVKPE